jgi:hypothetical protein
VIYRVKVKSPEYLQLMRLMAFCTYERTVDLLDANPDVQTWEALAELLQQQGRDRVPEEVLAFYRQHWERFQLYLSNLDRLRQWAESTRASIEAALGGSPDRKTFAEKAKTYPYTSLLFAALDSRLDTPRLRKMVRNDHEAIEALTTLGIE